MFLCLVNEVASSSGESHECETDAKKLTPTFFKNVSFAFFYFSYFTHYICKIRYYNISNSKQS